MPAALPGVDWNAAKNAIAAGVPVPQVAKDLGIPFRRLQKRAQRGENGIPWFRPHQALRRYKAETKTRAASLPQSHQGSPPTLNRNIEGGQHATALTRVSQHVSLTPKTSDLRASDDHAAALVLQNLERNDERISLLASGMALKAVENANKRKKSLPINTVQDLDKAVMISKRAAGKDRDDSKVTVALFGGAQAAGAIPEAAKRFRVRVQEAEVITGESGE
jgi:hypothetical protein